MKVARIALAIAGIVLVLYGGGRILSSVPPPILVVLGVWMVGALLIQHGVVSPLVVAVGAALRRVPDRGRRYSADRASRRRDGHRGGDPADRPAGHAAAGEGPAAAEAPQPTSPCCSS